MNTFIENKLLPYFLLILIVLLAAFLMFYKSGDSDFMQADEYIYFMGADIGNNLRYFISNFNSIVSQDVLTDNVSKLVKHLQHYGRPGYNFAAAIATFILGESKATAFKLSATLNTISVIIIYMLTMRVFKSRQIALLAALLLALNGGHVLYGRMAHQTPGAVLFMIVAFYYYVRSREDVRPLFFLCMTAVFYGLSFSVHPSSVYAGPVFVVLEIHRFVFRENASLGKKIMLLFRNCAVFALVFLLTISIWELPHFLTYLYFLAKGRIDMSVGYFRSITLINNIQSYFGELLFRSIYDQSELKLDLKSLLYFPSFLKDSQGSLYFIVLLAAIVYFGYKMVRSIKDYKYLLFFCWTGFVYLLYSVINVYRGFPPGFRELRTFTLIIPPICIILAYCFHDFIADARRKKVIRFTTGILLTTILFFSVSNIYFIIRSQASYKKMNDYLKNHPEIDGVITNVNVFSFAPRHDKVLDKLDGFVIANSRPFIKDENMYHFEIGTSRVAVLYRNKEYFDKNSVFCNTQLGATWDDIKRLYREGRVRYLLSAFWDRYWIKELPKVEPVFSYPSPFVCRARIYDLGIAPDLDKFYTNPYNRRIGLYDLKDIFGPADTEKSNE